MVQAVLGALAGQSKRDVARERPQIPSTALALASVDNPKMANKVLKAAREDRLYSILAQPEILGFIMLLAGIALSNNIPFSSDEAENNLLQGIATTASVVLALGYAGVGDLTALSVAVASGGASILGGLVGEAGSDIVNPFKWKWPLGPIWNW